MNNIIAKYIKISSRECLAVDQFVIPVDTITEIDFIPRNESYGAEIRCGTRTYYIGLKGAAALKELLGL